MATKLDSNGNQVLNYSEILGQFIKRRRTQLGLSQEELASKLGYDSENSRSTVAKIEAGKQDITVSRLKALAKALDVDVKFLVTLDESSSVGENAYSAIIKYADSLDESTLKRLAAYFQVLADKEE